MRCNNCLQVLNDEPLVIYIFEHPQGSLRVSCKNCGWSETYLVSAIPKTKTPFCKIQSVYEIINPHNAKG